MLIIIEIGSKFRTVQQQLDCDGFEIQEDAVINNAIEFRQSKQDKNNAEEHCESRNVCQGKCIYSFHRVRSDEVP